MCCTSVAWEPEKHITIILEKHQSDKISRERLESWFWSVLAVIKTKKPIPSLENPFGNPSFLECVVKIDGSELSLSASWDWGQHKWEFVRRSTVSASRTLNPDHLSVLINQSKPNIVLPFSSATMKSCIKKNKKKIPCFSADAEVQPAFSKLLSWLTRHWTSPLCLEVTANVSRCLFRVRF